MDLINDGAISLLYSPPRKRAPHLHPDYIDQMIDPAMDWVEWNMSILDLQPKEILAECFKMLQKRFPNVPEKDLLLVVEKEVLADMREIQLQPEIMDNYRRILAIIEPRKDAPAELDGVSVLSCPCDCIVLTRCRWRSRRQPNSTLKTTSFLHDNRVLSRVLFLRVHFLVHIILVHHRIYRYTVNQH